MNAAEIIACALMAAMLVAYVALVVFTNRRWWATSADERKSFRAENDGTGDW